MFVFCKKTTIIIVASNLYNKNLIFKIINTPKFLYNPVELAEQASDLNKPKDIANFYQKKFQAKGENEIRKENDVVDGFEKVKENILKTSTKLASNNRNTKNKKITKNFVKSKKK